MMKKALNALPAMAAALLLVACGDSDLPADEQGGEVIDASASGSAIDQSTADAAAVGGFSTEDKDKEASMPTAMRGRWGLVELDCSGDPAAAKGLIAIDATGIKFYESRAEIAEVQSRSDDAIAGQFDFEGEGQQWSLDMNWTLGEDGQTLVRTETGADAAPGPLEYQKCKQG